MLAGKGAVVLMQLLLLRCYKCFANSSTNGTQKLLTQNITEILDHLLKDYDSSQHPNYRLGSDSFEENSSSSKMFAYCIDQPTVIRTNILIRSMGPVSELDMDYSMDCYFRQYWRDPRLSFRGPVPNLSLNIKMLALIWRPDTYFHNGKNSYVHTITLPNKLLRISQDGDILYSMRLTIKAKCPMCLKNFPVDTQSCPLIISSYAYNTHDVIYSWDHTIDSVSFVPGMALSQFDLISSPYKNLSIQRREGAFSALQVNFNLERHAGYFLIQVYVPCVLIVVLSWVSFWINREATSDRVGLGITAVLTLSTISLDSRTDLPKVHYATALDWFLLMSFGYCMATLLEFAGVHYFTKVGSGEIFGNEEDEVELEHNDPVQLELECPQTERSQFEDNCSFVYRNENHFGWHNPVSMLEMSNKCTENKETQTERRISCLRQFVRCILADDSYRRQRQKTAESQRSVNSVSRIDKVSRILFPASFLVLNIAYWYMYTKMSNECQMQGSPTARSNLIHL